MYARKSPATPGSRTPAAPRPKSDPKQDRALRTRAQILEAAAIAFAAKGFPAVTVLDVAELTGMTKGAVYFHYANKEALAIAVVDAFYRQYQPLAEEVQALDVDPLEKIRELLIRTAVLFRDDKITQAGARLQIERSLINANLKSPFVDYTAIMTRLFTQAAEAGQLPAGRDPQALAKVLISAFFGVQHITWIMNDRADILDRVAEVIDAIIPRAD
jgi:AcrR family transcriptional regulator